MSTKEWVKDQGDYGIYQECLYDHTKHDINPNPARIQITNPDDFQIERETLKSRIWSQLTVDIPAEIMDELAIAWCKKRNLNTNKYTLDELLSKGNFKWPISEEELIEGLEEAADDIGLASVAKQREDQPEVELEYDNIFDVLTSDKDKAALMKKISNEAINQTDVSDLKGILRGHNNKLAGAAKGILKHIKANQAIEDEESLLHEIERSLLNNLAEGDDEQNNRD